MGAGERFMTCLFSLDLCELNCFDGARASKFNLCAFPKDLRPSNKLEGPGAQ